MSLTLKKPLISSILEEIVSELGIELLIEPEYGYAGRILTKDGKIFYYRSTKLDINNLGSSEVAKDKAYATYFMSQLGYPVPLGDTFYSDYWCKIIKSDKNSAAALRFAKKIGYPVIVKPNSESQGRGVEKVYNETELLDALSFIFNDIKDKVAIIQKVIIGKDYRIVVLKDEILCAYRRIPLVVKGDGKSSIAQLLENKQKKFIERGRDTTINIQDPRIARSLAHNRMTFNTILPQSQKIYLLTNANLSSGGEAEDVTRKLHADYKNMAITLTHEMGLTFCGIDIISPTPINEPMKEYTIIEINSAPGLDYYAEVGEKQRKIVKSLYKKLILILIKSEK